jgi:hypothetical protein
MRAFILAQDKDSPSIAAALRAETKKVKLAVDPTHDSGRRADAVKDKVRHDMHELLRTKFTHIVMGPNCEALPHAVAIAATAANLGLEFENIERIVPTWKPAEA